MFTLDQKSVLKGMNKAAFAASTYSGERSQADHKEMCGQTKMPVCQRSRTQVEARELGNPVQSEKKEGSLGSKAFLTVGGGGSVGGGGKRSVSLGFGVFLVNFYPRSSQTIETIAIPHKPLRR